MSRVFRITTATLLALVALWAGRKKIAWFIQTILRRGSQRRLTYVPKETYRACYDLLLQEASISLVSTAEDGETQGKKLAGDLLQSGDVPSVIGVDCEWENNKRVALLQIASKKRVVLVRLCHMSTLPPSIKSLLEDPKVYKVGVGILEDGRKLSANWGIDCRSLLDISLLSSTLPSSENKFPTLEPKTLASLKKLSSWYLSLDLYKAREIACSPWEQPQLTQAQVLYAAADAYYSLLIFLRLWQLHSTATLEPLRESNHFTINHDLQQPSSSSSPQPKKTQTLAERCTALLISANSRSNSGGGNYNKKRAGRVGDGGAGGAGGDNNLDSLTKELSARADLDSSSKGAPGPSTGTREKQRPPGTRKLFENCRILNPDGELMSLTNNKRVQKLLAQGLGEIVPQPEGVPTTLRLFTWEDPGGPTSALLVPASLKSFYLTEMSNACVGCGSTDVELRRHHIVPHCFHRHFPICYQSHRGHDSVLLCNTCHVKAEHVQASLIQILFREVDVMNQQEAHWQQVKERTQGARGSARVLLSAKTLPPARRAEFVAQVLAALPSDHPEHPDNPANTAHRDRVQSEGESEWTPSKELLKAFSRGEEIDSKSGHSRKRRVPNTQHSQVVTRLLWGESHEEWQDSRGFPWSSLEKGSALGEILVEAAKCGRLATFSTLSEEDGDVARGLVERGKDAVWLVVVAQDYDNPETAHRFPLSAHPRGVPYTFVGRSEELRQACGGGENLATPTYLALVVADPTLLPSNNPTPSPDDHDKSVDALKKKLDTFTKELTQTLEEGVRRLSQFSARWRIHFKNQMQPTNLPPHWAVDHSQPQNVQSQ